MRELASLCLDTTLLAQRGDGEAVPGGRPWERAVAGLLRRPGMRVVQQAGLHTLWGLRSASGAPHELDGAGDGVGRAYLLEAKATDALDKGDVAGFELKVTDFYFARFREVSQQSWWPVFACATTPSDSIRRICASRSIVLCDPARLPLPVLYHHALHPKSETALPELLTRELRRLAPRALQPLQRRFRPDLPAGELRLRPAPYSVDELDDLLYLQEELTDEVLARYDRLAPGRLEARAARLARTIPTVEAA